MLVMGGSLGARSINAAMNKDLFKLIDAGIQVIWQTGKGNLTEVAETLKKKKEVCITEFIGKMNYAYSIADVVVSRAGAIAIAEICVSGKPSVLVPFPLAAEDHQTVNAQLLVNNGAALMVKDRDAELTLVDTVIALINDKERCMLFREAALQMGKKNADQFIAELIVNKMNERNA